MEMLWFVRIKLVVQHVHNPEDDHQREEACRGNAFSRTRHPKIGGTASEKGRVPNRR
jgi:hypothetical protein